MSLDAIAAAGPAALPLHEIHPSYGASLSGALQFSQAMHAAHAASAAKPTGGADAISPAVKGMMNALESVNGEASQLAAHAKAAEASGLQMSPGEMVMMTVRCQEFMFHCQLTSNIANRTSDGLQQLFRQQG